MRPLRTSPEYRQTAAVMARATVTAPEKVPALRQRMIYLKLRDTAATVMAEADRPLTAEQVACIVKVLRRS